MSVAVLWIIRKRKRVANIHIERITNETPLEYHKRLVYGKLVDKTLADIDYSELAEMVYGQSYSSDVARRMLYGSRKTLELMDAERASGVTGKDLKEEIDYKLIELRKEQQKFFDQRREYNKVVAAESRQEHLYDVISAAAAKLNQEVSLTTFDQCADDCMRGENEAVLVFSDWHYGMKASNIFNEYNTAICIQRVSNVVDKAIQRIELHKCSAAHIVILGDLFHGAIHVDARVASEELVCEQIMHVSEILARAIGEVSKHVDKVYVYTTYGNHARTVQNKKDSIHGDNMERIVPWWLEERFSGTDRVQIVTPDKHEFIMLDVCGHGFCASHGDLDSINNSTRLLTTLFHKALGVDIEYILLGDKHHRASFAEMGVTSMLCGSLCGTDGYANEKRLYNTPSQILLIVNEECGVDAEYRLSCN